LHGVRRASLLSRAKELRQKGEFPAARTTYERLLRVLPEDGEIWYGMGRVEQETDRLEQALECYRKAAAHGGTAWLPTWAWIREAACLRAMERKDEAREVLTRVIEQGTDIYSAQSEARTQLQELEE
jgi:tetratricopeptide (TPR) repeat protein